MFLCVFFRLDADVDVVLAVLFAADPLLYSVRFWVVCILNEYILWCDDMDRSTRGR